MATNVIGIVLGGTPKEFNDCNTVADVKKKMNATQGYIASVNGEPVDDDYDLDDYAHVALAPAVKGGC